MDAWVVSHVDNIILILHYFSFKIKIMILTETCFHNYNKDIYNIENYKCMLVVRNNKHINKSKNIGWEFLS